MHIFVKQNPLPANSQNYNRYSYALNNPLVYTDPGGYRYNGGGGGGSYYIDGTQVSSNMFYMWVKRSMKNDPWNDWTIQGFGLIFEDFLAMSIEAQRLNWMEDLKYASYLWEQELKQVGLAPRREHQSYVESSFDMILDGGPLKKNNSTVSTDKPAYNTYFYKPVDAGGNKKEDTFFAGYSINFSIATPIGGYSFEGGYFLSENGKKGTQYISYGVAYGLEFSASYNINFIIPKSNFKFDDLKGKGSLFSLNVGIMSFNIFGNSSPDYPENSVFDTYRCYEIGIGPAIGRISSSFSPATTTKFVKWIPDLSVKKHWWGFR